MSPPALRSVRSLSDLSAFVFYYVRLLLTDPRYFTTLAWLVVLGDTLLTELIVRLVPYTEIDWETYIYQLELYLKGERDYALISGPTGPLVYPAGHLYVHKLLYAITDSGRDLHKAQRVYSMLYIANQCIVGSIYQRAGNVPNWVLLLLPLSKRLHSIYVLRLFNDGWAVLGAQAAVLAYATGWVTLATLIYSLALSVKMSVLLYLPGILVVLFMRIGLITTLHHVTLMLSMQALIGLPFLREYPWSYLNHSYEFTRVFLYKWTVNWRFLDEETFLSPTLAKGLLGAQLVALISFGLWKWCRRQGGVWQVLYRGLKTPIYPPTVAPISADYAVTVLFTSNLIGILFARSLHYQFYSWYAQQLPFLAWRTKYPTPLKLVILLGIEYAWNVYPSTSLSSGILCAANAALLVGIWFGYPEGVQPDAGLKDKDV